MGVMLEAAGAAALDVPELASAGARRALLQSTGGFAGTTVPTSNAYVMLWQDSFAEAPLQPMAKGAYVCAAALHSRLHATF
jgi:hypothetical protein